MSMFEFGARPSPARLFHNPAGRPISYAVFDRASGALETLADGMPRVQTMREETLDGCTLDVTLLAEAGEMIRLRIVASISGQTVTFSLHVLSEGERFGLATVRLEGLAAVLEADPHARIALPAHGGRLIDPKEAADGAVDHRYNWVLDSFGSCAIAYSERTTAVVRAHSVDDQLTSHVGGEPGARYAQIGALLRHRYTVHDASYRRARDIDKKTDDHSKAYPIEYDFPVDPGTVTVELLSHEPLPVESGWVPGARRVFASLPEKPCGLYRGHMVYKIYVGSPTDGVRTTYAQAADIIRQVYARTGGAGQIVYIVGFQNDGHDDRYPDVLTPNTAAGTEADLRALAEDARALGAIVSFHDNYDDAYQESAAFEEDFIARDNSGRLLRGGVWNGKQAYWISLPQYAVRGSEPRIDATLARYPFLRDTYHLDVLTASVFRVDFRAGAPAGKQKDLAARLRVLRQFAARGFDVSSEACGLPFIGAISYFWHMQRMPHPLYEGDRRIPLVPFLAHGKADYAGSHTDHPAEILDGLLYGGFFCNDITAETPLKSLTDAYFMLQAPLDALRDQAAVSYDEAGGWKRITYESGASVAVQFESTMCRVEIGGRQWIENGTAMIPQADGSTLLYVAWEEPYAPVLFRCALRPGEARIATPVGVDAPPVTLVAVEGGLPVELPVGVAYRVQV